MNAYGYITHPLALRSGKVEVIIPHRPKGQNKAQGNEECKYKIRLPEPGQQIVAEVVHVVRRLIEWRKPAYCHVCPVHQFIGQFEYSLDGLGVEQKPEQAEGEHGNDSRKLPFFKVKKQHDERHEQRVEQHKQGNGYHAGVWRAHFQRLHQRGKGYGLTRAGIAQNGRCFAPHVSDKGLGHAHKRGGNQNKGQIGGGGGHDVYCLSGDPCPAVNAHEVKGRPAGDEGHIREQQQKQQRGEQYGIGIPEGPDKRFHDLHRRFIFPRKLHCLVGQQKAQNKGEAKSDNDAGVFVPLTEVVFRYGKNLFQLHMRSSLLFAAYANARAMRTLNSISSTATPTLPNIQREEGLSHSRGYSTNSLSK